MLNSGGWTLISLEFSYTNFSPYATYGRIADVGANINNIKILGNGSNYLYSLPIFKLPEGIFSKFFVGKLNSANINDKSTTTQLKININKTSFPPNNILNATNTFQNNWCSSWWWADIANNGNEFEIWNDESISCGDNGSTSGFIPRRILINSSLLSWNNNADTGTGTSNNFGFWFGK